MPLEVSDIDLQRTLFRFLTKSARKGELADTTAAREAIPSSYVGAVELPEIADGMQTRAVGDLSRRSRPARAVRRRVGATNCARCRPSTGSRSGSTPLASHRPRPAPAPPKSSAHRALKEWAAANGKALGAPADAVGATERWFPSGDESDAAFLGKTESLIVEVRPQGTEPHELQQAVFTLVKMRAVMQAEQSLNERDGVVRAMLVLEDEPAESIKELVEALGVELYLK